MTAPQPDWQKLGPMPTDPTLESKLGHVKHENNYAASDERVWIERSRANAAAYAASEEEFFRQLDKQVDSL